MVSHCANPGCGAQFLYFGEGHLIAVRRATASPEGATVEFFWLCGECASYLDLEVPRDGGPHVVPRHCCPDLRAAH